MGAFDGDVFDSDVFDCDDGVPNTPYWGPHFPDASGTGYYWGPHFPDGKADVAVVAPSTPAGAATLLLLESGSKVSFSWATDARKMWSGKEYRSQFLDDPKRVFVGAATLRGNDVRAMRVQLLRFAAIGSVFSLGLSYEAISVTGAAVGMVIPTTDTTKSDFMEQGQRVAITDGSGTFVDAIIQSFTSSSVTVDVDPGSLGRQGCTIVPTIPVYLDPVINFTRYRGTNLIEQWQISARAAVFGFPVQGRAATAALSGSAGVLHGVVMSCVIASGAAGNAYTIQFVGDAHLTVGPPFVDGTSVTNTGTNYVVHYVPGWTTVEGLQVLLAGIFAFGGGWVIGERIGGLVSDDVGPVPFTGGIAAGYGVMGAGATVATYDSRPLWDRYVQIEDNANDSIQSLTEVVDMNGLPISIGTANQSDWGRALYVRDMDRDQWQWLKAFLATVRGAQRAFWLPSFRADLLSTGAYGSPDPDPSAGGAPMLNLVSGDNAGNALAWFSQRDRILIRQVNGFTAIVRIKSIVDNLDGTLTCVLDWTLAPALPDPSVQIDLICWVELVRFDTADFDVEWSSSATFTFQTKARVVQQ